MPPGLVGPSKKNDEPLYSPACRQAIDLFIPRASHINSQVFHSFFVQDLVLASTHYCSSMLVYGHDPVAFLGHLPHVLRDTHYTLLQ